jgi:Flp pilus assembly protein TadG
MTRKHAKIGRRRGNVLIYVAIGMVAFTGFVSLAIDASHVRLVKTELQFAADASARHGAAGLGTSPATAKNNAVTAAGKLDADGSPVVVDSAKDVALGTWSGGTFTILTGAAQSTANAVQVTCHRTAAGGNAVSLTFAAILGMSSADVTVSSIAKYTAPTPTGIIGLNYANLSGSTLINSYKSSISGAYSAGVANQNAPVISNQNITMSASATIYGNATPGPGYSATGGIVTGSRTAEASPLVFPAVSVGSNATTNNNAAVATYMSAGSFNIGGTTVASMPAGTYSFTDFTMSASSVLNITGPVIIYVSGTLNLSGSSVSTALNTPSNLQINVASAANATISGSSVLYGEIYAPQAGLTVSGSGGMAGSIVANSIDLSGTGGIHFDESLSSSSSNAISVVK